MIRSLVLVAVLLLAASTAAEAQTSDDLFDSQTLQEVRLFMSSRDLRELRERYAENIYYQADFQWRDTRVRNVGVRVRGVASRSPTKPSLSVDFNRYISGQRFLGLRALVVDNGLRDPALIRERTSMAFITRLGYPAPRESFARVYINSAYQGLYTLVEAVDEEFLARTQGDDSGYLFEYKYRGPYFAEDLGDDLEPYKRLFEPQTHEREADSTLYGPIRDLFREGNRDPDSVWMDRVSQYVDLSQLVRHVAVETFLAENDGFLGPAGMANFYLYRPVDQTIHTLVPWDRDTTFFLIDSPIFERTDLNMLFSRALAFADLRALYLDVLERCARSASEDGWLEAEIARADSLIKDAVYEDAAKPFSNEEYDEAVAFMREFARRRPAFVLDAVATVR